MIARKLGLLPPRPADHPHHTVRLAAYLDGDLPVPPSVFEPPTLGRWGFDAFGNDTVSDCAVVAVANFDIAAGIPAGVPITTADVLRVYSEVTGYDPADPSTDEGAILSDVLTACHNFAFGGLGGHVLTAFAEMDHADIYKMRQAIATFGGIVIGLRMPASARGQERWISPESLSGENEPGSWGGHASVIVGYDIARGAWLAVSWGEVIEMEDGFFHAYCNEAWALLDGEAPGVDVVRLRADLARLAVGA